MKLLRGGALDRQTLTVGSFSDKGVALRGYVQSTCGTLSDGTFNPKAGATINAIAHDAIAGAVYFELNGALSNAGWTNMSINGTNYARASANTFVGTGPTTWTWTGSDPFPVDTTVIQVVFT